MLLKVTDIVATNVSYGPCVVCPFLSPFDPKHPHPLTSSFVSVDDTTFKKTRGTSIQPHTSILLSLSLILSPSFALSRTQKRTHSHSAHLTRTNADCRSFSLSFRGQRRERKFWRGKLRQKCRFSTDLQGYVLFVQFNQKGSSKKSSTDGKEYTQRKTHFFRRENQVSRVRGDYKLQTILLKLNFFQMFGRIDAHAF